MRLIRGALKISRILEGIMEVWGERGRGGGEGREEVRIVSEVRQRHGGIVMQAKAVRQVQELHGARCRHWAHGRAGGQGVMMIAKRKRNKG